MRDAEVWEKNLNGIVELSRSILEQGHTLCIPNAHVSKDWKGCYILEHGHYKCWRKFDEVFWSLDEAVDALQNRLLDIHLKATRSPLVVAERFWQTSRGWIEPGQIAVLLDVGEIHNNTWIWPCFLDGEVHYLTLSSMSPLDELPTRSR